jgi:hypothetical protein
MTGSDNMTVQDILVRKSIVINAPQAHVFKVFHENHDAWWPRSHHIGKTERFEARLEGRVGGRWYEVGDDGTECNWGRVLAWEPHERMLLSWDINLQWEYEPGLGVEVEVKFIAEDAERTRFELEHRKLEVYGDKAEMMRAVFDSMEGWGGMLAALAAEAEQRFKAG